MSYDLYFVSRVAEEKPSRPGIFDLIRKKEPAPSRSDLFSYFGKRENYTIRNQSAIYLNEDTGVYFSFDVLDRNDMQECSESLSGFKNQVPLSFNMNLVRPHTFGLEADIELRFLTEHFDLLVINPQDEKSGEREYTAEWFLQSWNRSNLFGYYVLVSKQLDESGYFRLPTSAIEACWKWNRGIRRLQADLGEYMFVPRISFFMSGDSICRAVVWGDGIPIAMPPVDLIVAPRDRFARNKDGSSMEIVCFAWNEIEPLLKAFSIIDGEGGRYHKLLYQNCPEEIERLFRSKEETAIKPGLIADDRVLNEEIFNECLRRKSESS